MTLPLQRTEKVSASIRGSGEPVPQLKLMVGSIRLNAPLVKSMLLKYSACNPFASWLVVVAMRLLVGPRLPAASNARTYMVCVELGARPINVYPSESSPTENQLPLSNRSSYPVTPTLSPAAPHLV